MDPSSQIPLFLLAKENIDNPTGRVQVQHNNNEGGHPEAPTWKVESLPKGSIKPMRSASECIREDMRLDPENPENLTLTKFVETAKGTSGPSTKVTRHWRSFPKGSRRRIVRDFLLRSASLGRTDPKDKLRDHTAALKVTNETHENEKSKQAAEDMKKAIVPRKQGLFDCLGFSSKAMKNMN